MAWDAIDGTALVRDLRQAATAAGSADRAQQRRDLLHRILREPLLHFLLAGGLLFGAAQIHADATDRRRIVVDATRVAKIDETFKLQYGSAPSPQTRDELIRRWVEEEALYREGVARGVDKDDEIIRRRIVQKMQFLSQDLDAPAAPGEADLLAYYRANPARYRTPERVSFSHIFFSADAGGEARARERAQAALGALSSGLARAPERGDRFADLYDYSGMAPVDAKRLFGETPLAQALFEAPVGSWSGPYRSAFGWHLARIASKAAPVLPPFEAVRAQVLSDAQADAQARANADALSRIVSRYHVVRSAP